jgi:hypothetical protein
MIHSQKSLYNYVIQNFKNCINGLPIPSVTEYNMSFTTHRLLELDIFQLRTDSLTTDERTRLAYQRAPEIARLYGESN